MHDVIVQVVNLLVVRMSMMRHAMTAVMQSARSKDVTGLQSARSEDASARCALLNNNKAHIIAS